MGLGVMATHRAFLGTFKRDDPSPPDWEREGISDVYLAPLKPEWTTDAPTHPGTWWIRLPGYDGRVVEVYSGPSGALYYRWSDIPEQPVPRTGLEWSSRAIVQPRERKPS